MESASTALVLLVQLSALLGTTSLSVKQGPTSLWVEQGSQVTLTCQVAYAQAWERLRIGWTKDGQVLCQTHVTNNSLSLGVCGPRGWLVWQSPGNLTLRLDQVSANDSGDYVCWAAVEIPELEESEGNGTHLLVAPDDPQGTPASSFPGEPRPHVSPPAPSPLPFSSQNAHGPHRTSLLAADGGGRGRGRYRAGRWDLGPPSPSAQGLREPQRRLRRGLGKGRCWTHPDRTRKARASIRPLSPSPPNPSRVCPPTPSRVCPPTSSHVCPPDLAPAWDLATPSLPWSLPAHVPLSSHGQEGLLEREGESELLGIPEGPHQRLRLCGNVTDPGPPSSPTTPNKA
ncbi:transmembrane and immunoglobulin domain-containing protein 2 isoform X1 [Elephas maximus indicus]|uniref:transmembrane and immunoglobulin domain-containing protein 2 isoform X1 n=1 Tax=Elephas maximus indicus TaxID=99487 RepID=UPI002116E10D|nr:transmembrane and immunoglobulin domain-containing protein 2 isoform X1 [Elephas maximus indicus]